MRESIKMKTENYNFKFRVSGLIIQENKILLVDMDNSGFLCLPGGYVELGETTEKAIERELLEEVGKKFTVSKYLGVVENYFINKYSKRMHEIAFYYLMIPIEKIDTNYFTIMENDKNHTIKLDFKWINLKDINNYNVKPSFLKQILKSGNLEFNHLVFNEIDKDL